MGEDDRIYYAVVKKNRQVVAIFVLKRILHTLLVWLVPICFKALNLLLAGNLPPFGTACVFVEDRGRFLMVRQSRRSVAVPGGYMRWRETPMQAAIRECKEETGLDVRLQGMVGAYWYTARGLRQLSTITIVFKGMVEQGGELRGSLEGQPCWLSETEMREQLSERYLQMLDGYLNARSSDASSEGSQQP